MKPIIGITIDMEKDDKQSVKNAYVKAVIRAGGLPILIPSGVEGDATQLVERIDGLLFIWRR